MVCAVVQLQQFYDVLVPWVEKSSFWDSKYFRIHPQGYLTHKNTDNFKLFESLKSHFNITSNIQLYWLMKRGLYEKPKCPVCGKNIERIKPYDVMGIDTKNYVYQIFCSNKCNQNSESTKRKTSKAFSRKTKEEWNIIQYKKEQTSLKNHGVKNPIQSKAIQQKMIENCRLKNGCDYTFQTENNKIKSKKTNLEKLGVENPSQSPEIREKMYETHQKRHGVKHPFQSKKIMKKVFDTRKKNGNRSKDEIYIESKLSEKFYEIESEFKSEKYPFFCDFYIHELDLYIEYQGFPGHGKEPYDEKNEKHQKIVENWKERLSKSKKRNSSYKIYIEVWTKTDPLKRETAKKNKLNWMEFFNLKQFDEWFSTL